MRRIIGAPYGMTLWRIANVTAVSGGPPRVFIDTCLKSQPYFANELAGYKTGCPEKCGGIKHVAEQDVAERDSNGYSSLGRTRRKRVLQPSRSRHGQVIICSTITVT